MKAFALGLLLLTAIAGSASAQRPSLDAARATRIASDYLATLGSRAPYITTVTLESTALLNGAQSWVIRWSEPIVEGSQKEIGVRVKMDGTMAHMVEDKDARMKRATRRNTVR